MSLEWYEYPIPFLETGAYRETQNAIGGTIIKLRLKLVIIRVFQVYKTEKKTLTIKQKNYFKPNKKHQKFWKKKQLN